MRKYRKNIIVGCLIILGIFNILLGIRYYQIKTAKIDVKLIDNLEVEVNTKKKVSDFIDKINGKIIDDYVINSKKLGNKKVKFQYINEDNIKVSYSYEVKVVDTEKPLIWLNNSYNLPIGSDVNLTNVILCGDNYDSTPKCFIEGEYSVDEVGEYSLVYKAIDQSGNETIKNFVLNVYEPKSTNNNSSEDSVRTEFQVIYDTHKNSNTRIGIDVSKWQGEVDFKKLKKAGVEFVIIRIGGTRGVEGEYFIDEQFKRNIKEANKYNIDVGLYFYSYANSIKQARKDAKWIIKQIENYEIQLPIAFDWEDWGNFNSYKVSFYELTSIGIAFMKELEKVGYDTMLYSSKTYLENIWFEDEYDVWLAHYTKKTEYAGEYKMWQLCDNGQVDGINGNVDIDILYK